MVGIVDINLIAKVNNGGIFVIPANLCPISPSNRVFFYQYF